MRYCLAPDAFVPLLRVGYLPDFPFMFLSPHPDTAASFYWSLLPISPPLSMDGELDTPDD